MILHKDKENFDLIIRASSRYFNVSLAIIEKDYYVMLVLRELAKRVPGLIFKGGTSLSKCYKIINRFSEDIDITLDPKNESYGKRKKLKYTIVELSSELGLKLINKDQIKSRRNYNCYEIDYQARYGFLGVNSKLLIETVYIVKSFPNEVKYASSMIYDFLKEIGNEKLIEQYNLHPFLIKTQTLDRTFVDKVFAICDYMLDNKPDRNSRHIYDLSRLLPFITLDSNLKTLISEVRKIRKLNPKCYSSKDGINTPELLKQIIDREFYKKDYEQNTEKLLSKNVKYDETIKVLEVIIKSGVFE